jgi:carbamoyl-phosphate synthase small subunit
VGSNGPGDPKDCEQAVKTIRTVIDAGLPYVGICLGHQLLALAIGADTYKLKYGHRGVNQPCMNMDDHHCVVTSQNHGYAVDPKTLPKEYVPWYINVNDQTNEGIRHTEKNVRSVQFHPEGHPGPGDSKEIFKLI